MAGTILSASGFDYLRKHGAGAFRNIVHRRRSGITWPEPPALGDNTKIMTADETYLLFSYGTLRNRNVQLGIFGRELNGEADILPDYVRRTVVLTDPTVISLSAEPEYFTVEPSADPAAEVPGTVFEITAAEMATADHYELGAGYRRIEVTLQSGKHAWVYLLDA